jgi:HSP20 family molecular chaperone IbpA
MQHEQKKAHTSENEEGFHTIDVHVDDSREHEDDIGQIALDIFETNTDIVIIAPVAGVNPDEIDISVARNILTIS